MKGFLKVLAIGLVICFFSFKLFLLWIFVVCGAKFVGFISITALAAIDPNAADELADPLCRNRLS